MASNITPSLRTSLERLKHGGHVNGLLLGWRRQLLVHLLPYEEYRAERLLHAIRDAGEHFASAGDRSVQTFWFGYEAVHVLAVFRGDCVLVMLHGRAEEVDFLKTAARAFLEDVQLRIDALMHPSLEDDGST